MLQVELRVNGVLIDFVDIKNVTKFHSILPGFLAHVPKGEDYYEVEHGNGVANVYHNRKNGAIKLAALALDALAKEK